MFYQFKQESENSTPLQEEKKPVFKQDAVDSAPSLATVFVIDNDPGTLASVRFLLESEGLPVQTFSSAASFLRFYEPAQHKGCVLLDVNLDDLDGWQLHGELKRMGCVMPIIYLTGYGSIPQAVRAMQLGAADFLTKPFDPLELLKKLRSALYDDPPPPDASAPAEAEQAGLETDPPDDTWAEKDVFFRLTPRERDVLKLVLKGHANKLIARELGISYRTVELHRSHILRKTGKSNMMELAQIAYHLSSGGSSATENFELS